MSGTSRPFVSQSFDISFGISIGEFECLLRVSIANEHKVSASRVFCDYVLEIFRVPYSRYLIPIPMEDVCMIVEMDWLSRFEAMAD